MQVVTLKRFFFVYVNIKFVYLIRSNWKTEFPWEESMTTTSNPTWTNASSLCLSSSRVPIAAPTGEIEKKVQQFSHQVNKITYDNNTIACITDCSEICMGLFFLLFLSPRHWLEKKCHPVIWGKKILLLGKYLFILTCPMAKRSGMPSAN